MTILYSDVVLLFVLLIAVIYVMYSRNKPIMTLIAAAATAVGGAGYTEQRRHTAEPVFYYSRPDGAQLLYKSYGAYVGADSDKQVQQLSRGHVNDYTRLVRLIGKFYRGPVYEISRLLRLGDRALASTFTKAINDPTGVIGRAVALATTITQTIRVDAGIVEPLNVYLDIGCSSGEQTQQIAKMIGATTIHGADVNDTTTATGFTYHKLTDTVLPFGDGTFDIVSILMTLHHVGNVPKMLSEIARVLKPGGILYVKEHDCWDAADAMLIDLEHLFYHTTGQDAGDYRVKHYYNYAGWDQLVRLTKDQAVKGGSFIMPDGGVSSPYKFIAGDYFYSSGKPTMTPTRAYWSIYKRQSI